MTYTINQTIDRTEKLRESIDNYLLSIKNMLCEAQIIDAMYAIEGPTKRSNPHMGFVIKMLKKLKDQDSHVIIEELMTFITILEGQEW